MPKKKCGFGFSCAAMMMQPGLEPKDCLNYKTCGSASQLTPEEEVELIRVRVLQRQEAEIRWQEHIQQWEQVQERIRVSRRSAAIAMLMQRGCPQTLNNFGITDLIRLTETRLQQLRSQLEQFATDCYIAPDSCEAHCYNVKRPYGTYGYNKLTSKEAIFEPEEKQEKVKVLHLSHDDDPRNTEGRRGIERRNRLHQVQSKVHVATRILEEAIALLGEPLS